MERQLSIRMAGPGVLDGKFALRDLQRIVHPLEQALRAILPASKPPGSKGGRPRKPQVRFLLSGIESGSAIASGEIDTDLDPTLSDLELEPLALLVDAVNGVNDIQLPDESRRSLERIAQNLRPGINYVELTLPGQKKSARIHRRDLDKPAVAAEEALTLSGRLISIDFRAGLARLEIQADRRQRAATRQVLLRFPDELANDMQRCARQQVVVRGGAALNADRAIELLTVQQIQVALDDRRGLWAPKRFRWPTAEERLDNVDMDEFLRTSSEDGEGDI